MVNLELIMDTFVRPEKHSAQPADAEPLPLHSSPANRPHPRHRQEKEKGEYFKKEPNNVDMNIFNSGQLTPDQEKRRQVTNNNHSASTFPAPSSVSYRNHHNGDHELASEHFHHHHQPQQQGMSRHKFSRLSAGATVTNRSLAMTSPTVQMKQCKAVRRQMGADSGTLQNNRGDYVAVKKLYRCVGHGVEESYEEQGYIRQMKGSAKRHREV
ncbi:hypothetical protein BGZ47_005394 [Haplosporangium gracile]|nr:hypothetical protein BGZ47_005394 [Haplosporangium gracile]